MSEKLDVRQLIRAIFWDSGKNYYIKPETNDDNNYVLRYVEIRNDDQQIDVIKYGYKYYQEYLTSTKFCIESIIVQKNKEEILSIVIPIIAIKLLIEVGHPLSSSEEIIQLPVNQ